MSALNWTETFDFLKYTLSEGESSDIGPADSYPKSIQSAPACAHLEATLLAPGVLQFTPNQATDTDLILSCAVHGNETAPIEICNRLTNAILAGDLNLRVRLLVMIGNIPAIKAGTRFIDENLNRLFKPDARLTEATNPEQSRAIALMAEVDRFFESGGELNERRRIHLDLHTAIRGSKHQKFAVHPFLHGKPYQERFIALLSGLDCTAVLLSHEATGTFSYFSSKAHGAEAATVELGKVMPFGENNPMDYLLTETTLRALLIQQFDWQQVNWRSALQLFQVSRSVHKQTEDFSLNFADDTFNFTQFETDSLICQDGDTAYTAQAPGEAIVFPNANVAIGQRALLLLQTVTEPDQRLGFSDA
ncbi:succinylglutamate desuccinylase [Corallincola platygyrae]|uniref:Succinylglutamate desuccinylase n=1 Tax=Corallincola platygyrae TaxID=1193278 RepID=A0ABW4XK14_9GAMM